MLRTNQGYYVNKIDSACTRSKLDQKDHHIIQFEPNTKSVDGKNNIETVLFLSILSFFGCMIVFAVLVIATQ